MALQLVRRPAGADFAAIIAGLPEWFGIPEASAAYVERAERDHAWVAQSGDHALGVMVLSDTGFSALDIHFLAVRREAHRQGIGRILVKQAISEARARHRAYLTVKTLGPSRPSAAYEQTTAFYRALGFEALEEFAGVWPGVPCLVMILPVPR